MNKKITRLKTVMGEVQSASAVELETIVERMRSEKDETTVANLRRMALLGRLAQEQGEPRYLLEGIDRLPHLLFGALLRKGDTGEVAAATGLLLLNIICRGGADEVADLRRRCSQLPYTLLAFEGLSGTTLKVVVRLPEPSGDLERFMNEAQQSAVNLYGALLGCDIQPFANPLLASCRLSHDPQLYFHAEAAPMPVVAPVETTHDYDGAVAADDGVVDYPDNRQRQQRLKMELQTCVQKAIDEGGGDPDRELQLLADYCAAAHLPEEGCVSRIQWMARFRSLGADLVRKTLRTAYKEAPASGPLSQMNEKERIMRSIEDFLSRRYQLRYNVVKQVTEFRPNDLRFQQWMPLDDRQLRSIVVEEMKEGGESWMNDMRTYMQSAHVRDYNPIHEFLDSVGEWDGRHDYIEDFARRLPTGYADWPRYFHRWFLAMVAQALNLSRDFGNSMVPMLIGGQGIKKSTFCKNILPPSLREYYMDDIKMQNAEQVERVLGRMWLVCIDEYNAKTDREQAKIKRLLTEKDVQIRRMRSDQYTMTPRLCSFIATTNDLTPLPSGDGSRRYLCVEVAGEVDMSSPVNYRQLYAQAVTELRQRDCLYWFTSEDERLIQLHNQQYRQQSSLEQVLQGLFVPSEEHSRNRLWTALRIQQELSKHLQAKDRPSLRQLGMTLKRMNWPHGGIAGHPGYYLLLRSEMPLLAGDRAPIEGKIEG